MTPAPKHLEPLLQRDLSSEDADIVGRIRCGCGSEVLIPLFVGSRNEEAGSHYLQVTEIDGNWFLRLGCRCPKCSTDSLIFDDHFHGWNGFVCAEEYARSLARPDFDQWHCQKCRSLHHRLAITIQTDDMETAIEEGGDLITEQNWFEAFGWFTLDVTCADCGHGPNRIIDHETM
jgi:hypothetical protein